MNRGYIKLWRKITEWEWYQDSKITHLFIHLLLSANHQDNNWKGLSIKRGQILVGRKELSEKLGISEQSIRTCINKLKSTSEITTKSTNRYTLITLVNFEQYQPSEIKPTNKSTNSLTNNQPTTNQQLTTNKNDKNDKNDKNKNIISNEIIEKPTFGNTEINQIFEFLKNKINGSPDGSVKENRQYANLLIKKIKKDYPDKNPIKAICLLIELGLQDSWHQKNLTNFKYIYYNTQKIIASSKNNFTNQKFITI